MGAYFDKYYNFGSLDDEGHKSQVFQICGHVLVEHAACVSTAIDPYGLDWVLLL